jgi:hypothetical protein
MTRPARRQAGRTAYGVRCNSDDAGNFDYICGVEVSDFSRVPPDWYRARIPERRYAVFSHRDHISTIRRMAAAALDSDTRRRISGFGHHVPPSMSGTLRPTTRAGLPMAMPTA